jgi:hypothetical protein
VVCGNKKIEKKQQIKKAIQLRTASPAFKRPARKYKRATLLEYLMWFHFQLKMHPVWQLA